MRLVRRVCADRRDSCETGSPHRETRGARPPETRLSARRGPGPTENTTAATWESGERGPVLFDVTVVTLLQFALSGAGVTTK